MLSLQQKITNIFSAGCLYAHCTPKPYQYFTYPRIWPLLHFHTDVYRLHNFGYMTQLHTRMPFGTRLLTCSFTPSEGNQVPYLLIDLMSMKQKYILFIEYYDCTAEKTEQPFLQNIYETYKNLPDYTEKPAWYIDERAPYSLIKQLTDPKQVTAVIENTITAYKNAVITNGQSPANRLPLYEFRNRMLKEGNPSEKILKLVFGANGYKTYFKKCVMPL